MFLNRVFLAGWVLLTACLAASADINSSIRVGDDELHEGDLSTVNGRVTIGERATVRGKCQSVNGDIRVGADARADGLSVVNGDVALGQGAVIENAVKAVNGRIEFAVGSRATTVTNVNGTIRLTAAQVAKDVRTINGDITLDDGSSIGGNIVIEERGSGWDRRERPLKITLAGNSVVEGDVIVEDPRAEVKLYLRDGSRVLGRVENAQVIRD